ncbi:MAG: hypothetical protein ACR2IK_20055 [Chloroflexota bacterium]
MHKAAAMVVARTMPEHNADVETIRPLEHQLTNHLTLTLGYAELLAEDPDLPERLREMAHLVLENAQAAGERVRSMRQVDAGSLRGPSLDDGSHPGC